MGTGKSTVSASLARLFGYEEIDTDIQIASQQNQSISEIFECSFDAAKWGSGSSDSKARDYFI